MPLGWPGAGETVTLTSFSADGPARDVGIAGITLLHNRAEVEWSRDADGLKIVCPSRKPNDIAFAFKMELN